MNYIDTLTMFYNCSFDIIKLFTTHWIWDDNNTNENFHHLCIQTKNSFIYYFPNMYHKKRLYFTCSLPKFYMNSCSNAFPVINFDEIIFMDYVKRELGAVMDISTFSFQLSDWQPSRIDLFRMRPIPANDRMEYHIACERLTYRGAYSKAYKNTIYLPSSKKSKHPSIILRTYNKTEEIKDNKKSFLYGNLPKKLEDIHEELMSNSFVDEELEEQMIKQIDSNNRQDEWCRYEFSLRRSAIKRFCNKYKIPLNMEELMKEDLQKKILNDLVISRGLHYTILCKNEYRAAVQKIMKTKKSITLALQLAESIRNGKNPPMTDSQRNRIRRILNKNNINTATSNNVTIQPLKLL